MAQVVERERGARLILRRALQRGTDAVGGRVASLKSFRPSGIDSRTPRRIQAIQRDFHGQTSFHNQTHESNNDGCELARKGAAGGDS